MFAKSGYFTSRYTPVECSMKAQSAIVAEEQVVGMATDSLVLIRKTKGNMFQTVLRARLERDTDGTAITLSAGMDRIVMVFLLMFLGAFLLLCLTWTLAYFRVFQSFQFSDEDKKNYLFILMPFVCTALGVALVMAGRYVSKPEGPFLTRLFCDATDAKSRKAAPKAAPKSEPKPAPKVEAEPKESA